MSLTFPIQRRMLSAPFPEQYQILLGKSFKGFTVLETLGSLKTQDGGWTIPISFLLDIGAAISLLPDSLLNLLEVQNSFKYDFYGVVHRQECKVPAKIARIIIRFEDEKGKHSPEFPIVAAFTSIRPMIPLLGMMDCIEKFQVRIDVVSNTFTLGWNDRYQKQSE